MRGGCPRGKFRSCVPVHDRLSVMLSLVSLVRILYQRAVYSSLPEVSNTAISLVLSKVSLGCKETFVLGGDPIV